MKRTIKQAINYESPLVFWVQNLDVEGVALCASNNAYGENIDWGDDESSDYGG